MHVILKPMPAYSITLIGYIRIKTNLFLLILSLFFTLSCSTENEILQAQNDPYLSIPDTHFERILIDQGIDSDSIINQKILKADAEKIGRLDLNREHLFGEIKDMTGIEGFINLTYLSAARQNIESIDLSFNTQLDTVFLYGNYLTTIDFSKNSNLILINIQSNELHSISGLENAINLTRLDLSFNYLKEFAIHHVSLEQLLISHNLLESFDASGSASLKFIFLVSNELSTIDLSSNVLLETLIVSDNELQSINLAPLDRLTHFYASSNSFTSLDVSNNEKLIDLRVDRNPNLACIRIHPGQEIPTVSISNEQALNSTCQ